MEKISELIAALTGVLEGQVQTQLSQNMPGVPTAILYGGRKSLEARNDIMENLRRIWRARADSLLHLLCIDGSFYSCPDEDSLTPDAVQDQYDSLFALEGSFRSMDGIMQCLVLNTADCSSLEDFKRAYTIPDALQQQLGLSDIRNMKLILLDESGSSKALAREILDWLREAKLDRDPATTSTVILSSRLRNGVLLAGQRIHENYALAGSLIVLANNYNPSFESKYYQIFPIDNAPYVTAAYARVYKQNAKITEVVLNTVLNWLGKQLTSGRTLSTDDISQRLGITGGAMKMMDDCFERDVASMLPSAASLERLPRSGDTPVSISRLPFADFNKRTMGAFQPFYEQNVSSKFDADDTAERFRSTLRQLLNQKFTPQEAACSFTQQVSAAVAGQISHSAPSASLSACDYLRSLARDTYFEKMEAVFRDTLIEYGRNSHDNIQNLTEINEEFLHSYMLNVDDTLKAYYEKLTGEQLEFEFGGKLLELINSSDFTTAGLLNALYLGIQSFYTSHEIFSLPLDEEMTRRMGGDGKMVQSIIRNELTSNLSSRLRLRTAIAPIIKFSTVLVNQHSSSGSTSPFYSLLTDIISTADCLDTGNRNAVEFIQLYALDTATL